LQNESQGTKLCKAKLKKIAAYEEGEKQKVLMDKEGVGAAIHSQGHTGHDEESGDGMNPVVDNHGCSP
jgi:hypothetical protein